MDFKQRVINGKVIRFKGKKNNKMTVDFKGSYFRIWVNLRIVCIAKTYENAFEDKLMELIERYNFKEVK